MINYVLLIFSRLKSFPVAGPMVAGLLVLLVAGCAPAPYDYSAFEKSRPRSVLVIPPLNNTTEVNAPYSFLSAVSSPLAEKGYYVFPVSVVEQLMRHNGLQDPAEMNNIPLDKINEHINPDAVLYVAIENWGQQYRVFSSVTVVESRLRLVDAKTGEQIWHGFASGVYDPSVNSRGGLLGAFVAAIATQIANSTIDRTPELARQTNSQTFNNPHNGLLDGPYKPAAKK